MEINLSKFGNEIVEFCCEETLRAIDYGVLDLSHVRDRELRHTLYFLEELLTVELELNYLENSTGIFRVHMSGKFWCYKQGKEVLSATSLVELKEIVESQKRIWYVFDDIQAKKCGGKVF